MPAADARRRRSWPGPAPAGQTRWRLLLDSGDAAVGGHGSVRPDEAASRASSILLEPWAFCVYGSEPARPAGEPEP